MDTIVNVVVRTVGGKNLDRLKKSIESTGTQLEKLKGKLRTGVISGFRNAGNAARKAGTQIENAFRRAAKSADGLKAKLTGLRTTLAGLGTAAFLGKAFQSAADFEAVQGSVDILTGKFEQYAGIQELAAKQAEKFVVSQKQALSGLVGLGNRLGPTGASLDDLASIYDGFNTLLVINGTSAQEAAAAQLQLNQALGAGALAGDEFRSISEAAPALLVVLEEQLGVTRAELKKLSEQGKLTSAEIIKALKGIADSEAGNLAAALSGSQIEFRKLQLAIGQFTRVVGQELLPILTPLIQAATDLIKTFSELPGPVKKVAVGITLVATAFVLVLPLALSVGSAIAKFAIIIAKLKLGAAAAGVSKLALAFKGLKIAVAALTGPVGLLAAGAVAVGVGAFAATKKINDFNSAINKVTSSSAETKTQIDLVKGRLKELEGGLDGSGNSARGLKRQIQELKKKLEELEGTYKVQIEIETIVNEANAKTRAETIPDFDKLTDAQIKEARQLAGLDKPPTLPPPTGGGAAAAPQDDTEQAQELLRTLTQGNDILQARSQIERDLLETEFERLDTIRQINELQGITPELRDQLSAAADTLAANKSNTIVLDDATSKAFEIAQAAQETLRPLEQQRRLLEAQLSGNVQRVQDEIEIEEAVRGKSKAEADYIRQKLLGIQALRREVEATKELDALYKGIGDTIQNGIISAIDAGISALVDGTKDLDKALQDILAGVLKDIGNQLIKFGINAAFGSLGNSGGLLGQLFGGGRAEGGAVSPDKTFLVGEKGPELFTPTTNGTIIPNDFFDSARASLQSSDSAGGVNDDVNSEAFAAAAAAIERNTANIVNRQSTISQESSFNDLVETLGLRQRETIRFETVRVGEMDMVTKDEALKIGADSAKAAEASVFSALRNKPSVRKSIGMG